MRTFLMAAAAALSVGAAAEAANFEVTGGSPFLLTPIFDPTPSTPDIPSYAWGQANGALVLDGPGRVSFTYIGSSTPHRNLFSVDGQVRFDTKAATNQSFTLDLAEGLAPFSFSSNGVGSVANGGPALRQTIAFYQASPTTVFALFNDRNGLIKDYDDMVVRMDVAPVPLPAAAWLLLGGIGGLGAVARRRRGAATA